jgi:hypothetical protein
VRLRSDQLATLAAFLVPWIFGLLNVSLTGSWTGDLAVARTFAESPLGFEGLVSASLSGLASFLPLGTALTRAGSVSALALGLAGLCIYRLSRQLLDSRQSSGPLAPAVALLSALTATLGPSFVSAGTVAGGAAVAAALGLAGLERASSGFSARHGLFAGALLALTFCESRLTALTAVLAFAVLVSARGRAVPRTFLTCTAAGAAGTALLPAALGLSLLASPGRSVFELFAATGTPLSLTFEQGANAVSEWRESAGLLWVGVALLGLGVGLANRGNRGLTAGLLAILAAGALSTGATPATAPDPLAGTRLLGVAALAITTSAGLAFLVRTLGRARLPFARAAGALIVVYGFSLVFVSAEDASRAADERESSLAERWTDEAWLSLPPKALLLVRTDAVFLRLLASRTLSGSRPDVLIVPTAAINQSSVRLDLVEREAALVPVVRDVLLTGKPSELSLSGLADARPMYVELDPNWDARLYAHLVPHSFFSEFAPQPLGRSDRSAGVESATERFDEVAAEIRGKPGRDPATREVLAASLSERAILLEALGDRASASSVTDELLELAPRSSVGLSLRARFANKGRQALDVRALLASR